MNPDPRESEPNLPPALLTVAQAAQRLNMSEAFIHKLKRHSKLTPVKLGGATRYRLDDIDRLVSDGVVF